MDLRGKKPKPMLCMNQGTEEGEDNQLSGGNAWTSIVKKLFNGFKRKEAKANAVYESRDRGRGRQPARPALVQVPYMSYPYVAAMQFPGMPYQKPMQMQMPYSTQVPQNQASQQQQVKGLNKQKSPH